MAEGRADRDNGDLQGALRAFAGADAIMHVPTTGLEVARTEAALGLLVEAWGTALRVSRIAERPAEPAPFKVARDAASVVKGKLEARIPLLTVTVENMPPGSTGAVTIDDVAVSPGTPAQPRMLDPGRHRVSARTGGADRTQEIDLIEGDRKELKLELPVEAAVPRVAEGIATATVIAPQAGRPGPRDHGATTAWTLASFGLAGAGLVTGAIAGAVSLAKTRTIERSAGCAGTVCGPAEYGDIHAARSTATLSTVAFIAAAGGAGVGLLALLEGRSSAPPNVTPERSARSESATRLEPWLAIRSAGVRGTFP
jgi:hypothetical protein